MRWTGAGEGSGAGEAEGRRLASELGVSGPVGLALWARGVRDEEAAHRFLEPRFDQLPDPSGLKGIDDAVARLQRALEARETVCVYGDYDVDGVTSTALLVSVLRAFADFAPGGGAPARIDYYVPNRLVEGYGLNLDALRRLSQRGTRLVVTADCGVTAVAEIDAAAQLRMDVVVIDHHTSAQTADALPRAAAILNPHQPGCPFPARELAAVGVAFHLLLALRKRLREAGWFAGRREPNLREQLDLVARRALVVSSRGWHLGVAGIVASRLVERFHRPALVLCEEEGGVAKGSGRSVEGFHLYDALARCAEHLTRFGGHRHAAGVTLPTSAVAQLAESLEQVARERLDAEQLTPRLRIDAVLRPEEIDVELASQLRRLAPFGAGNPE